MVYTYIISVSGSNYQLKDGTTGQLLYESADPTEVANYAIANVPIGGSILFNAGTYNLNGSITGINKDDITLVFETGATLFVANGMNAPAILLSYVNNWLIQNPTIDGNKANQVLDDNDLSGIQITFSSNCRVDGANIYNVGRFGFYAAGAGSVNVGIINSKITNCDWNGITLGGGDFGETELYAHNNEVAHSSDVGIACLTYGCIVTYNNVHDMDGTLNTKANWGIAVEIGGNCKLFENIISRCRYGIVCSANPGNIVSGENLLESNHIFDSRDGAILLEAPSNTVKNNEIIEWDILDQWTPAIWCLSDDNKIFGNILRCTHPHGSGIVVLGANNRVGDVTEKPNIITTSSTGNNQAILIESGAVGTIIENNRIIGGALSGGIHILPGAIGTIIRSNDFSKCTNIYKIWDEGTGTLYGCPTCDLTFPSQEELAAHIVSAHPAPTPSASVAARVPCFGNRALVQVYLRKLRDKIFSRKLHEKLHPLI